MHGLNRYNLENYLPCLNGPKFRATEPSGSEEEDFSIFPLYFYGLNTRPPAEDPFRHLGATVLRNYFRTHKAMVHTKLLSAVPSSPKEEDFKYILLTNPGPRD